jgi:hypothetical protein
MSSTAREGSSSQEQVMLPSPELSMRGNDIGASAWPSTNVEYCCREVIDGDVVRTYESRRRRQFKSAGTAMQHSNTSYVTSATKEEALQAALSLPSSVIIAQGLRRLLNSDEPLYEEVRKEQKVQLQREFLKEVGVIESTCDTALRRNIAFPPSPPSTPKAKRLLPVKSGEVGERRFCECCRLHCV